MNVKENKIVISSSLGHFIAHYNMVVFTSLVTAIAPILNISISEVISLGFWQFFLFGVCALPWGLAGDRFGARFMLMIMLTGGALSCFLAAFPLQDLFGFVVALAGIGLFSGIYHPIGMGMISKGVDRVSVALGYNAVCGGFGLVAGPVVTGICNAYGGPRVAFIAAGILNLIGMLVIWVLCPTNTERKNITTVPRSKNSSFTLFGIAMIAMTLAGAVSTGATALLPTFLELKAVPGIETAVPFSANLLANILASLVFVSGMIGQLSGGFLSDRYGAFKLYFLWNLIGIPLLFLMSRIEGIGIAVLNLIYFFFLLGMQAPENALLAQITPPKFHHSIFGIKYIFYFGAGAVSVRGAAWINTSWGIGAVYEILAGCSLLVIVALILLRKYMLRPYI